MNECIIRSIANRMDGAGEEKRRAEVEFGQLNVNLNERLGEWFMNR